MRLRQAFLLFALSLSALGQQPSVRHIDPTSTLTVYAYKTGLFSFAAHDHVISAPLASGEVVLTAGAQRVKLVVNARGMKVLDPKLEPEKRAEVQATMHSPKVLDTATYPQITFTSTEVHQLGESRWRVTGMLVLHGMQKPVTFEVTERDGSYTGEARVKQTAFGITPVSIAGGSIKVKDEVKVEFMIRLRTP